MARRHAVITEKKLANKRFRKTEEAILRVFFREKGLVSVGKIAKEVGVARSTFYRHHHAVYSIVADYKRYLLFKYSQTMHRQIKRGDTSLRSLYLKMLLFIVTNRGAFEVLLVQKDHEVIKNMINKLRNQIEACSHLSHKSEKAYNIYVNEVTGLIEEWENQGFPNDDITKLLSNIIYLTETARPRLVGIRE